MSKPTKFKVVIRDGNQIIKVECPGCGIFAEIDEDQRHGRVSLDCTQCDYHETHNMDSCISKVPGLIK